MLNRLPRYTYYRSDNMGRVLDIMSSSHIHHQTLSSRFNHPQALSMSPPWHRLFSINLITFQVFALWVLDSLHLVLCTIAIYWYVSISQQRKLNLNLTWPDRYLIRNFNNSPNLQLNHWYVFFVCIGRRDLPLMIGVWTWVFLSQFTIYGFLTFK